MCRYTGSSVHHDWGSTSYHRPRIMHCQNEIENRASKQLALLEKSEGSKFTAYILCAPEEQPLGGGKHDTHSSYAVNSEINSYCPCFITLIAFQSLSVCHELRALINNSTSIICTSSCERPSLEIWGTYP